MSLIVAQPIMWNTNGYKCPSGVRVSSSSFPGMHGFGHEEWNGSDALFFTENGERFRAFHTEGVEKAALAENLGRTTILMYASHDGVQQLVGVAGQATFLGPDEDQRKELAGRLRLGELGSMAWALESVQRLHKGSLSKFEKIWTPDVPWIPNWKCPEERFLWLEKPVSLNPKEIRGKKRLLSMFGRHTVLEREEAARMLRSVVAADRNAVWHRILHDILGPDGSQVDDILQIEASQTPGATSKEVLVAARLGQGAFREGLERLWDGRCSVSGCGLREVLRASHIKPWSQCNDGERLDAHNGLLLTADLDALFDRGLISFSDQGSMLVSPAVEASDVEMFGLTRSLLKPLTERQKKYLSFHRKRWSLA